MPINTATVQIDFHKEPWVSPPRELPDSLKNGVFPYPVQYDCKADNDLSLSEKGKPVDISFEFVNPTEWGNGPDALGFHSPKVLAFAYKGPDPGDDWVVAKELGSGPASELYISSSDPFTIRDVNNDGKEYQYMLGIQYTKNDQSTATMGIDPKIHNAV